MEGETSSEALEALGIKDGDIAWVLRQPKPWRLGRVKVAQPDAVWFSPLNGDRTCHFLFPYHKRSILPIHDTRPPQEILEAMDRLKKELRIWVEHTDPIL